MNKKNAVNVKDIKRAIVDIEKLNLDLGRLERRATPDIVGFYGELLVWKELKSRFERMGYEINLGNGQSRADIVMKKGNDTIGVEIKTSRLKNEWYGEGYGAALNVKQCGVHSRRFIKHPKRGEVCGDFCYFNYLIFVQLPENFKNPKFFIFTRDYLWNNEKQLRNINKRFSSATHRIIFIKKQKTTPEITQLDISHTKNQTKFKNNWSIIK